MKKPRANPIDIQDGRLPRQDELEYVLRRILRFIGDVEKRSGVAVNGGTEAAEERPGGFLVSLQERLQQYEVRICVHLERDARGWGEVRCGTK